MLTAKKSLCSFSLYQNLASLASRRRLLDYNRCHNISQALIPCLLKNFESLFDQGLCSLAAAVAFVNGGSQTKGMPCVLALKSNVWCPPEGRRTLILCGYYKINMIVVAADVFESLGRHARGNLM